MSAGDHVKRCDCLFSLLFLSLSLPLSCHSQQLCRSDVEAMIREADSNDDNQISEKEFETLFLSSDELRVMCAE